MNSKKKKYALASQKEEVPNGIDSKQSNSYSVVAFYGE